MATYVVLQKFTDKGKANLKHMADVVKSAPEHWAPRGLTIKEVYLTMGQYDLVTICEATDETMAKAVLRVAAAGELTTETLLAFSPDEFVKLASSLP